MAGQAIPAAAGHEEEPVAGQAIPVAGHAEEEPVAGQAIPVARPTALLERPWPPTAAERPTLAERMAARPRPAVLGPMDSTLALLDASSAMSKVSKKMLLAEANGGLGLPAHRRTQSWR